MASFEESETTVTGNHFTVETFDIERVGQKNRNWALNRWVTDSNGEKRLPIKVRKYRIRVPFEAIR